jgi:adenylate cyclase
MANIKEIDLDWPGAEEEYERALELDPNSVRVHETYAWDLQWLGRLDEAMPHLKRAQELDPLGLDLNWDIAVLFNFSRQYDRAIEQFQKIIEMDPNYAPVHGPLALSYQEKGMYEEAIAVLKKANVSGAQLAYAYAGPERETKRRKYLMI